MFQIKECFLFPIKWGFTIFDTTKLVINARCETLAQKPLFRQSYHQARCLIPISGFYEWTQHIPYMIKPVADAGWFIAGIWRVEQGRPVFCVITEPASKSLSHIHHRMPCIIPHHQADRWLSNDGDIVLNKNDADKLLENDIAISKASNVVNNPKNNNSQCIESL